MNFGEKIKFYRKRVGMTQSKLASAVGVATGTIQQYELGKRTPNYEKISAIADALEVKMVDLMGMSNECSETTGIQRELIEIFAMLNFEAKEKVLQYADDLSQIPKYLIFPALRRLGSFSDSEKLTELDEPEDD